MFQGGVAFAAFGALTLAAASPASADTYGWAYASALGGTSGAVETFITQDQTVTDSFSSSIGSWLTVEGTTTATVNSSGATGTAVVDTARIVITEADLPGILNPEEEDEDEEETEDDDTDEDDTDDEDGDTEDGDGDTEDGDGDTEDGDDGNEDGNPNPDDDATGAPGSDNGGNGGSGDPSDVPTDEQTEAPVEQPSETTSEDDEDDEDEVNATASAEVIELDEENSELANNGSDVLLEGTVSGASVSTSQTWDGAVSHSFNSNTDGFGTTILVDDEEVELKVVLESATAVFESHDAGFVWNDAVTDMYILFSVGGEVISGYPVAESAAGITTGVIDGGGDNGGDNGDGGGDDKTPPQKERDKDTLPKTEAKDAEPLAQTGSPLVGLIAAGAAIAAGGGAAAYLARRKKKNGEEATETAETNEN